MRYISIWRPTKFQQPSPELQQKMGAFIAETVRAGVLLATEGFGPSCASDFRVRQDRGKLSVTDGPFTEAKEVIGGFAIMQVKSREEMLEWTRRFLEVAGDGEAEIHQLSDQAPLDMFKAS